MSNEDVVVGIDLGTTNSLVAVVNKKKPEIIKEGIDDSGIMPSCVGLDQNGQLLLGSAARNQYAYVPERTVMSVKRLMGTDAVVSMGDKSYRPQEISAIILKSLKEKAERVLGRKVNKAVITVPAFFTDSARNAIKEAGEIAGLEVLRIINEPTAAALAYEGSASGARKVMVYDLGGGTFDVSIVQIENGVVEVLASAGDNHLGGDDFDQLIVDFLRKEMKEKLDLTVDENNHVLLARLKMAAERAKIELSDEPFVKIEEDHVGEHGGETKNLSVELSRHQFEELIQPLLEKTMASVTRALRDADITPSDLDKIFLVGGSTRIPKVVALIKERLGVEPHGEVEPDLCVALGAGVHGGIEAGLDVSAVLVDVTPYTFGTCALAQLDGEVYPYVFSPIIRRNSKLPVQKSEVFFTLYEEQEKISIRVFQGEEEDALKNVEIGSFLFEGLNQHGGEKNQGIIFTYSLDLNGILHIRAVERSTGKELRAKIDRVVTDGTQIGIEASRKKIGFSPSEDLEFSQSGGEHLQLQNLIDRAKAAMSAAAERDQADMALLINQIEEAVRASEPKSAERAAENLEDILLYVE